MRAKFTVRSVLKRPGSVEIDAEPVKDDGIPENRSFNTYTPSGSLKMTVCNPAALDYFQPGECFYLDFSKVDPS